MREKRGPIDASFIPHAYERTLDKFSGIERELAPVSSAWRLTSSRTVVLCLNGLIAHSDPVSPTRKKGAQK
jgi:hypothetical protein